MSEISELLAEIENLTIIADSLSIEQKSELLDKFKKVYELDPQNIFALFYEGIYYFRTDNCLKALEAFKKIVEIAPDNEIAKHAREMIKNLNNTQKFNIWKDNNNSSAECFSRSWEKVPCELLFGTKIIVLFIIICFLFPSIIFSFHDKKILKIRNTTTLHDLEINPRFEYSFLSKQEIFDIRKSYVAESIFAHENYKPSEREFGSIVDYKPWWGDIKCQTLDYQGDYHEYIQGESIQSLNINNPNMLVGLSNVYIPWDIEANKDFCHSEYSKFVPYSFKYDKKNNLIIAEYKVPRSFLNMRSRISGHYVRYPIQLSGLNALDFGYQYVYAYNTKNIEMHNKTNNITKNVGKFTDYIHLGGSCHYEGGCNNISPLQYDKMITLTGLPAEINLKLWKKTPKNRHNKANMYYRIIFNEE